MNISVSREEAIDFLNIAARNWRKAPSLSEEDIGDIATALVYFLSKRNQPPRNDRAAADKPAVFVKKMTLSDGRADYFVAIRVGDREVTPHVFREEFKAAYHVALYSWLLNGTERPDLMAFDEKDWPAQATEIRAVGEPDYCYDPSNWEFTCNWDDRDQVHGHGDALDQGDPMEVATLIRGPSKWVADVPIEWDEDGDPIDTEVRWFDSEEAVRAALAATEAGK